MSYSSPLKEAFFKAVRYDFPRLLETQNILTEMFTSKTLRRKSCKNKSQHTTIAQVPYFFFLGCPRLLAGSTIRIRCAQQPLCIIYQNTNKFTMLQNEENITNPAKANSPLVKHAQKCLKWQPRWCHLQVFKGVKQICLIDRFIVQGGWPVATLY